MPTRLGFSMALAATAGLPTAGRPRLPLAPTGIRTAIGAECETRASVLRKHDRLRLAGAYANNDTTIRVLIAAAFGSSDSVAAAVAGIGGRVDERVDAVAYLRATVPISGLAVLEQRQDVCVLNIDGLATYANSAWPTAGGEPIRPPPNPVAPVGVPQFLAAHPTYDGRGTTIGIVDQAPDLLRPELRDARRLDGTLVRKVVDVETVAEPSDCADVPGCASLGEESQAQGGILTAGDQSYRVPRGGAYRLGMLDERRFTLDEYFQDLNRDGNPSDRSRLLPVLVDEHARAVWIDHNQNGRFDDETELHPYGDDGSFVVFGSEDARAAADTGVAVLVQLDTTSHLVWVIATANYHGTGVASAAAGSSLYGTSASGAAPGAQVIVAIARDRISSLIEGVLHLARDPRVDVISVSWGTGVALNDDGFVVTTILDRVVDTYDKLVFVGTGNGPPGLNAMSVPAGGNRLITVGSYIGRDLWQGVAGFVPFSATPQSYLRAAGHRAYLGAPSPGVDGPREDGGFAPSLVAPSIMFLPSPSNFQRSAHNRLLPNGRAYLAAGGTSFATPIAAGSAAVLISAARQAGTRHRAADLRDALLAGARYLPGIPVTRQGMGLLSVPGAWDALQHARGQSIIRSRSTVRTVLARYLSTPYRGPGLYEREGWVAGQRESRIVALTRIMGPGGTVRYGVSWRGNDGTFAGPETVDLPLGVEVAYPMSVAPARSGSHSAVLELRDSRTGVLEHTVMVTVVAARRFASAAGYRLTTAGRIEYPGTRSVFLAVPAGARALRMTLRVTGGEAMVWLMDPTGIGIDYLDVLPLPPGKEYHDHQVNYHDTTVTRTIARPAAGVWQLVLDNANYGSPPANPPLERQARYTLTASVEGFTALAGTDATPAGSAWPDDTIICLHNRFAGLRQRLEPTDAGAERREELTLAPGRMRVFPVDVPAGSSALTAEAEPGPNDAADVDLYGFDCSSGPCRIIDHTNRAVGGPKTLVVRQPTQGRWKIVLDAAQGSTSGVRVLYRDVISSARFGALLPVAPFRWRGSGERWCEPAFLRRGMNPGEGRSPTFAVELTGFPDPATLGASLWR